LEFLLYIIFYESPTNGKTDTRFGKDF
jgi:hypothetical protein